LVASQVGNCMNNICLKNTGNTVWIQIAFV
jgi:hypothetical protein